MSLDIWETLRNSTDDDIHLEETEDSKEEPELEPEIITTLNELIVMEMTGINQYLFNKSFYKNLQFNSLVSYIEERLSDEYKHYDMLQNRVRYLRGNLNQSEKLNKINTGSTIPDTFKFDAQAEKTAIFAYNKAINVATKLKDNGTRALLESILKDEEDHLDDLGAKLDQVNLTGIQIFLGSQI